MRSSYLRTQGQRGDPGGGWWIFAAGMIVAIGIIICMVLSLEPSKVSPLPTPLSPLPTQQPYRRQPSTLWLPHVEHAPRKGLGLTYGHCEDAQRVGASWFYTWSPWPKDCEGLESVPMIWGQSDIGKTPRGTSIWLLGFNEPDRENQADVTPGAAAELWREIERLYGDDWLLVSPAVSHTDIDWLRRFYGAYLHKFGEIPVLDALAVHCYANDVQQCLAVVREVGELAEKWGVLGGVWLTEFAFWPVGAEEVGDGSKRAEQFSAGLGGEPHPRRFAWFAARMKGDEWWMGPSTALVEFDGSQLTSYGLMYKGE